MRSEELNNNNNNSNNNKQTNVVRRWLRNKKWSMTIGFKSFILLLSITALLFLVELIIHTIYERIILIFIIPSFTVAAMIYALWSAARAQRIQDTLLETHIIASESTQEFELLFSNHLIKNLVDKKVEEVRLLISTPAFGYHPLGEKACKKFIDTFGHLQCHCELILFTPDGHFFHWLNTLLWEKIGIENGKLPTAKAFEFINLLDSLKSTLTPKIEKELEIWATNKNNLRMFNFSFQNDNKYYLVLADNVAIQDDLREFKGRSFPIPMALQNHIGGSGKSYFNQFKYCPYSLKTEDNAKLQNREELEKLFFDYFVGRTEQTLFNLNCFFIEIERLCNKLFKRNSKKIEEYYTITAGNILAFFEKIIGEKSRFNPSFFTVDQMDAIAFSSKLKTFSNSVETGEGIDMKKIKNEIDSELEKVSDSTTFNDNSKFRLREVKDFLTQNPNIKNINLSVIYLLVTSGFGQSQFAER